MPFSAATYRSRRAALRASVGRGPILFLGLDSSPRNYPENTYAFRQCSHFLYYVGIDEPGLACLLLDDREILFAPRATMDDVVWSGPSEAPEELARRAGIAHVATPDDLGRLTRKARVLPTFRAASRARLSKLKTVESSGLVDAVARQRSIKTAGEIADIESALAVTDRMHRVAMRMARPGVREDEIAAAMTGIAPTQAYLPIVTVRGEILHNRHHRNTLEKGQLLLVDAAAESRGGYASDITRVTPVGGRFSRKQAEIYEIVLRAQLAAIDAVRPGIPYCEVHLRAARVIAEGLVALGLMRGDVDAAVAAGAHALFFPHGVGHMLGLDVHDMEDLGDVVGYAKGEARSKQFGLSFLRLARPLEAGFVLTVEPGLYFIPALMDQWRAAKRHREFIVYARLDEYRDFGGVRIEDNVLVTRAGARVLGPRIPKTVAEVERAAR